jgi:phage tail-like protein
MAELSFNESYRTHGFALEIEGTRVPATKVSGLQISTDTIDQIDGGDTHMHRIATGFVTFEPLVIERNVDGSEFDQLFQDWFREMFQLDGESNFSSVRRNGAVIKLENGREVMRFLFREGWVRSVQFADLEAGSTNLFKQTVEIIHDGLEIVRS